MPLRPPTVLSFPARHLPTFLLFAVLSILPSHSQNVLTYHNDTFRSGLNNNETILNTSNVNSTTFGKLFAVPADGLVDAEPLYISAVPIAGVKHNVLIVATENDSVYAYDADTGAQLWKITTLLTGETASDNRSCDQVTPQIGITSTPVIYRPTKGDPVIYVVAMSKDSAGDYHQRLHALDATTGAELYKGPVEITAQYPGTGDNSSGGYVIFNPAQYKERAGLLLLNGTVYLAWASHCDNRPYTGWIMGYNATTLAQTTVLNVTPNGSRGAIWGAGAGMAADTTGSIYLLDGNGVFDADMNSSGFPENGNYGNAFLRLNTSDGLAVGDYFEMDNEATENGTDIDLGSGGAILVSVEDKNEKTWHLAVGAGKDTNIYVVNRMDLGKYSATSNNIYQQLTGALPGGMWSVPATLNSNIFYGAVSAPILKFQFNNALLEANPVAKTTTVFGYPGTTPSISANNGAQGIVWATENTNPAILHAYSSKNLSELYNTTQAANGRDNFGAGNKFITPMIANGKVYVGTTTGVGVFGLLPAPTKNQEKK
jgi:hypothetical protein